MRKNCLGFPIKKGRLKMRIAKEVYRNQRVSGLVNFRLPDYNKYGWKVGDLAHDCDGFNWRIGKIVPIYATPYHFKRGKALVDIEFYKEDGSMFCHVSTPGTYEEITQYWEAMKADQSDWNFAGNLRKAYGDFTINGDGTITPGPKIQG